MVSRAVRAESDSELVCRIQEGQEALVGDREQIARIPEGRRPVFCIHLLPFLEGPGFGLGGTVFFENSFLERPGQG